MRSAVMPDLHEALSKVVFEPEFDVDPWHYDAELGFYTLHGESTRRESNGPETTRVLGFGLPRRPGGGFDTRQVIPQQLVDFKDLGKDAQNTDTQGKGVGPRMYNTPQAAAGLTDIPKLIGVYTFELSPDKLLDRRQAERDPALRVLKHAVKLRQTQLGSTEEVVADVHRSYGEAETVLYTQPPRALVRQLFERWEWGPRGIMPEFLIIRHADVTLRRVGRYAIEHRYL